MAQKRRGNLRKQVAKGKAGTKVKTTPKVATAARAALVAGVPVKKVKRQIKRAVSTTVTVKRPKPGKGLRRSGAVEASAKKVRKKLRPKRSKR